MRLWLLPTILALLGACASTPPQSIYREVDRTTPQTLTARPAFPGYGGSIGRQPIDWTPLSLAADFRKLMFYTEWGDRVPRLLRWERPVRIELASAELRAYRPLLDKLLATIAAAAPALRLSVVAAGPAEITLRTAPRAEMSAIADDALCFFVPIDADWPGFVAAHRANLIDWRGLTDYEAVTIFIPAYAPPHEIRSCILEEVTQALGPGNDLSGLGDSIYNDDNAHVWPTSFDLLMLDLLYDPSLSTGMDEAAAERTAAQALARRATPPFGPRVRTLNVRQRGYDEAIAQAIGGDPISVRERAARRAIMLASRHPPADHRLGEAFKAAAFVAFEKGDVSAVIKNLLAAEEAHSALLDPGSPHLARVRAELAINLVNLEEPDPALALLDSAIPVFAANAADWQLTHALRWRAIALSEIGQLEEARRTALETVAWAGYIYGGDSKAVAAWRAEFAEIGLLAGSG